MHAEIVHNASVLNAVGTVGLQLYKYGRTASIVFPQKGWTVEAHYDVLTENKKIGLHTLCLLDINIHEPSREDIRKEKPTSFEKARFMTVNEGIQSLLEIESKRTEGAFTEETLCIGCARLGGADMKISVGTAKQLLDVDFGEPLHCLIVPGNLHFMEEEAIELWK